MLGDAVNSDGSEPAIYNDNDHKLNLYNDYQAIKFMQENIQGSPVIVEGHSSEYRWGSRFSIHTGLPSVIGWSWHIRQHNSLLDGAYIEKRIQELDDFYNTVDLQQTSDYLDKYSIGYIVVGDMERAYYSPEGLDKFRQLTTSGKLRVVFGDTTSATTTIYEVVKNTIN